jgi:hypothetical protein
MNTWTGAPIMNTQTIMLKERAPELSRDQPRVCKYGKNIEGPLSGVRITHCRAVALVLRFVDELAKREEGSSQTRPPYDRSK